MPTSPPVREPNGPAQESDETALEFRERRQREARGSVVYAVIVRPAHRKAGFVAEVVTADGVDARAFNVQEPAAALEALRKAMDRKLRRDTEATAVENGMGC